MHTAQEQYEYLVSTGMPGYKAETWARVNVIQGVDCIPHAIVTYAKPNREPVDDPGASIAAFYAECRAKYSNLAGVFVGD